MHIRASIILGVRLERCGLMTLPLVLKADSDATVVTGTVVKKLLGRSLPLRYVVMNILYQWLIILVLVEQRSTSGSGRWAAAVGLWRTDGEEESKSTRDGAWMTRTSGSR